MEQLIPTVIQYTEPLFKKSVIENNGHLIKLFSQLYIELAEGISSRLCNSFNDIYMRLISYMSEIMCNANETVNENAFNFWLDFFAEIEKSVFLYYYLYY